MKKYLVINPFKHSASHGIGNYTKYLQDQLNSLNIEFDYLSNEEGLNPQEFQKFVYNFVHDNYGIDEVIIEAPEARAATLLLESKYNVHIRMHTPGAVAQKYDSVEINQTLFSEELRCINKAKIVSSPSYGLLKELKDELVTEEISVYKNPAPQIEINQVEKDIDLIFMGRFQSLKGTGYINQILEQLPKSYNVVLIGNNSTKFKPNKNVKCSVECLEQIESDERFDYVARSKNLMLLSKFENCSMVILEALACNTVVHAWNVGGNQEIAPPSVLRIVPFEDCFSMAQSIVNVVNNNYPTKEQFNYALESIDSDFKNGLIAIIKLIDNDDRIPHRGINHQNDFTCNTIKKPAIDTRDADSKLECFGERILGIAISNEHIEEMWMPIIDKFSADYRFLCRRPLGFTYKFGAPVPVDRNKYKTVDWIEHIDLIFEEIKRFKPNKILFHNGLHPMYRSALKTIKARTKIPIIYTELGWLPQKDHIYFDEWGTNGMSKIASQSYFEFCGSTFPNDELVIPGENKPVLVVTQTENDTNMIVNSDRFKKNTEFVRHVINEIGENEKIIIKTHPLDANKTDLDQFISDRVEVIHEGDLHELMTESKAIIGINSTVLIEALKYDINIYMFGKYLLDNKGVIFDCKDKKLSSIWENDIRLSRTARECVLEGFKRRQVNLKEFRNITAEEAIAHPGLSPIFKSKMPYGIDGRTFSTNNLDATDPNKVLNEKIDTLFNIINTTSTEIKAKSNSSDDMYDRLRTDIVKEIKIASNYPSGKTIYKSSLQREIVRLSVKAFSSEKKYKKFLNDPDKFFLDSEKSTAKFLGKIYNSSHN